MPISVPHGLSTLAPACIPASRCGARPAASPPRQVSDPGPAPGMDGNRVRISRVVGFVPQQQEVALADAQSRRVAEGVVRPCDAHRYWRRELDGVPEVAEGGIGVVQEGARHHMAGRGLPRVHHGEAQGGNGVTHRLVQPVVRGSDGAHGSGP